VRILIVTQHFAPEVTAARVRVESFAKGLMEMGHDARVLAAVPNHPEGVIQPDYRGRARSKREWDGIPVTYVWVKTSPVKSTLNRLLYYGTFAAGASLAGAIEERPDVVVASSPPLPVGAAGAAIAARHRIPWIFDVRDLWPEVAVALGELTNPRIIAAAERLERRLYRSAAAVATTTEPFASDIRGKLREAGEAEGETPVAVLPNGTTRLWVDAGGQDSDRAAAGLPEDAFVWSYAGNLGLAQGLEHAVRAAEILGDGFHLMLVGDGPKRAEIEEQVAAMKSGSVTMLGLMQPARAAELLRASDALLVSLGADPALRWFVPSKLFDFCALGRPVLLAAQGEAPRLAESANAALQVEPGDPEALAAAVRRLRDDPTLRERLGEAGRAFGADNLRERQARRLGELIESLG
jgi:glycosyltransferase involved in cell wall biosynthesis